MRQRYAPRGYTGRVKLLLVLFALTATASATVPCKDFSEWDVVAPSYSPIGRAAHIEGTVKMHLTIDEHQHATVEITSGPKMLAGAAKYLVENREYAWNYGTPTLPCEYDTEVEYRLVTGQSDTGNSFLRVTILGPAHTLIEAQNVEPSCSDCSPDLCTLEGLSEGKSPDYPPIARAAHVSGVINAVVNFDKDGKPNSVTNMSGPEILKKPTKDYLLSWKIPPLPSYLHDSCHSNLMLEYFLGDPTETTSPTIVTKADATHILIESSPALLVDPAVEITKRKRRFLF
jgi:hypothetical protein